MYWAYFAKLMSKLIALGYEPVDSGYEPVDS